MVFQNVSGCTESTRRKKQPFFQQAKRYVADLAFQKTVTVRTKDRDRWHRTVGEVILPGHCQLQQEPERLLL